MDRYRIIREILCGPFTCGYWPHFNQDLKHRWAEKWGVEPAEAVARSVALYDPVETKTPLLRKYGLLDKEGRPKPCRLAFVVTTGELMKMSLGDLLRLDGVYNIAFSDALYGGLPTGCRLEGAEPVVADVVRLDVDVGGDFDAVLQTARAVHRRLKSRGIDARFMRSGGKGFHIWITPEEPLPAAYRPAVVKALSETLGINVDTQAADPARVLRMPYTTNLKTGRRTYFFDPVTGEEVNFTWPKPVSIEWLRGVISQYLWWRLATQRRRLVEVADAEPAVRRGVPRWVRRLIEIMCETGEMCHHGRVAIARSLLAAGRTVEEVVETFKCAKDFNEKKTRYHVEYEAKRLQRGEKPWSCRYVAENCPDLPRDLCSVKTVEEQQSW